ncbi:hypothetical protein IFM89_028866 [Coptis chinensis]|uniref:Uncharacterized protein n=1 Tax=Coptis chinensis TaxID=261450 RepID=A0A835H7E5_9MAGN|nr:hypothetical protein IFM89_028866 [Coptis chinensis]
MGQIGLDILSDEIVSEQLTRVYRKGPIHMYCGPHQKNASVLMTLHGFKPIVVFTVALLAACVHGGFESHLCKNRCRARADPTRIEVADLRESIKRPTISPLYYSSLG